MINRDGHLLLIKSFIGAKLLHLMLIADAPAWLLEEVNKWMMAFFWVAKDKVNGGQCLVAWDNICKHVCFGGLGVKNLKIQGLALRVRWEWLRRTGANHPWGGLPIIKDDIAKDMFDSLVKIKVGNGHTVMFWTDRWLQGQRVEDVAPLVLNLVKNKARKCRTVQDALLNNRWIGDIDEHLAEPATLQLIQLWICIAFTDRNVEEEDQFTCPWSSDGIYSEKSTYNLFQEGNTRFEPAEAIWENGATLKCKI
jgi:hypothetical protein